METTMHPNEFDRLAFKIAAKSPDLTSQDYQRYEAARATREKAEEEAQRKAFEARQQRLRRDGEARPAPSSPSQTDAPDENAQWVPLLTSLEFTIITRSRGETTHHDWGFTRPGSNEPQQLFVAGNAFSNFVTMVANLSHRMKR